MSSDKELRRATNAKRWVAGLAMLGSVAVACLMALTPAATAASAGLIKNATPVVGEYAYDQGCASSSLTKPSISLPSGAGKVGLTGKAKTCGNKLGGTSVLSYSDLDEEVGAAQVLKLSAAASTVNTTFAISAAIADSATGKLNPAKCPTTTYTTGYSLWYNSTGGTSWGWLNESYSTCEVESFAEIYVETEVYDLTTGTYTYGFNFLFDNNTGSYYELYTITENWTNPAWASMNYSCYNCTSSFSWGPSAVNTLSGT